MTFWQFAGVVLAAFWSGAIVAMLSGTIFAYIVFKTKRDPHEALWGKSGGGGSYISDPALGDTIAEGLFPPDPEPPEFPSITKQMNEQMLRQINAQREQTGAPPLEAIPGTVVEKEDKYDD